MDEWTWTFSRAGEQLQIRRVAAADGHLLEVTSDGAPRVFRFDDLEALVVFQNDMEAFLLKTGWAFSTFHPERRSGGDRRDWPRISERRRWWTDAVRPRSDSGSRNRRKRDRDGE